MSDFEVKRLSCVICFSYEYARLCRQMLVATVKYDMGGMFKLMFTPRLARFSQTHCGVVEH